MAALGKQALRAGRKGTAFAVVKTAQNLPTGLRAGFQGQQTFWFSSCLMLKDKCRTHQSLADDGDPENRTVWKAFYFSLNQMLPNANSCLAFVWRKVQVTCTFRARLKLPTHAPHCLLSTLRWGSACACYGSCHPTGLVAGEEAFV